MATSGARGYGFYPLADSGISLGQPADYSDRVTTRALAQRAEEGTGFGELVFRSRVTVEYTVEGK